MFVDTAKVSLKAGKGGDGAVSFRHEIYIPKGGPDGGDGGRGGNIIFVADKDTDTLLDFRYNPILTAEDGRPGSGQRSAGRAGKDLYVEVPVGTVVWRSVDDRRGGATAGVPGARSEASAVGKAVATGPRQMVADLTHHGQQAIIAHGGAGGFGNAHFKSSTRQTPIIHEVGEPGEEFEAELELKLLADVGLVGLPNAGKSTFLSVVTNAKPEIADYPFTTITPNLGVATIDNHDLLIADIPGLIEGASDGKGLGHAFLRHIDRTAVILHLIDAYSDAGAAYRTIRSELEKYSDLSSRPEIVALTKCEGLDPEIIAMQTASILRINPSARVYAISAQAHQGLDDLLRAVWESVRGGGSNGRGSFEDRAQGDSGISSAHVMGENSDGQRLSENVSRDSDDRGSFEDRVRPTGSTRAKSARDDGPDERVEKDPRRSAIPTITLPDSAVSSAWTVTKQDGKFLVTGAKIEKFARRTDFANYASLNRLRDIMKKLGIRAELTSQGAKPDSVISIAGHEFPLVEDY